MSLHLAEMNVEAEILFRLLMDRLEIRASHLRSTVKYNPALRIRCMRFYIYQEVLLEALRKSKKKERERKKN